MRMALDLARRAASEREVPVGCVIVQGETIVGQGYNRREQAQNALFHAEIIAIHQACQTVGYWRLPDCRLYVTLEPCPMCAGAIVNARIAEVIFGTFDPKAGAVGSVLDLFSYPLNHRPSVISGLLKEECSGLLTDFFKMLR